MGRRKIEVPLTYAMIKKAVKQAAKHDVSNDVCGLIKFPNMLGITKKEFSKSNYAKRTKTKKP